MVTPDAGHDGPVLLVTGASGAIGSSTARAAAAAGYRLVLAGRRADVLDELAVECGGAERCIAVPGDIAEWDDVRGLVEATSDAYGRLDVAFLNAGQSSQVSFLSEADAHEEWRSMVLTNVYGVAIAAKAVLPMLTATRGHLVLTGSVAGRVPVPGSLYSATKWAITAMGQSIRAEVVGTGVHVTVVEPGLVDTPAISSGRRQEPKLHPADIARAVLFAVSQPAGVDVNEIVVRPVGQSAHR